jgi:uncharacterized protein (DUF302 family)
VTANGAPESLSEQFGNFVEEDPMKRSYLLLALFWAVLLLGKDAALAQGPDVDGLVTVQTTNTVDETVSQLQSTIQDRGLTILSTVDHAANAQSVGQELRPTQLIIFGNPKLGTQLMRSQQSVGIDLPQKFLVWEDESGQVNVSYNDPQYLLNRHNLAGVDDVLTTISTALGGLTSTTMPAEATESAIPGDSAPTMLPVTGANTNSMPWWLIGAGVLVMGAAWLLRRRGSALLVLVTVPLLLSMLSPPGVIAQEPNGLVSVDSPYSVQETVNRLQTTMEERGLTVMTTINHAANAHNVGMELRPTQLIIFGNPKLGTQLMQSQQSVGIDLPQKFLVWEDAEGQVHMTYNDPRYLAQRHGIAARDDVLTTISNALSGLAKAASAP